MLTLLEDCLRSRLKECSTAAGSLISLKFYNVVHHVTKQISKEKFIKGYHRRIFLVQDLSKSEEIVVCGLEAYEFPDNAAYKSNRGRVYLQYVDTSGYIQPRESSKTITYALVHSYIDFLRASREFHTVHIFARAQPEYIFASSERNVLKRPLSDVQLVKWWAACLEKLESVRIQFLIPSSPQLVQSILSKFSGKLIEGFPFPVDAVAADILPLFPDDPKTKQCVHLVESADDENIKVNEFFSTLACRSEFSNCESSFFFISFVNGDVTKNDENVETREKKRHKSEDSNDTCNAELYKDISINSFEWCDADFSSRQSAISSTAALVELLKNNNVFSASIEFRFTPVLAAIQPTVRVLNVQNLVKRPIKS